MLFAAVAHAGEYQTAASALTGPEYMVVGEESYNEGDYDKALDSFRKALPLLKEDQDKARAHKRLAFIYAAFGRMDDVYSEFVESLKLDPSLTLDPGLVSPKIYEAYKKAREDAVREGTLVCNCDPAGAEVYLDGTLLGLAPVRKERIPEGEHTLTLKKPGYEASAGKVTIKKDITLTVEDKLAEARGELDVTSEPPGASVVFDGREEGVTPITLKRVSGGGHKLVLKRDYFDTYEMDLTTGKSENKAISMTMKRRLLLIGMVEGGGPSEGLPPELEGLTSGPFSGMSGLRVIPAGLKPLAGRLAARGLEPGSLAFLEKGKLRLDLEDSAVLSGIMEEAGTELALVIVLRDEGARKSLTLTLYGTGSDAGDGAILSAQDMDGLKAGLEGYLRKWSEQQRGMRPSIGARLVDRTGGGVEITSELPGFPASEAGLVPGDIITAVDGTPVAEKKGFLALLKPGIKQEISVLEDGRTRTAVLSPREAPVETPVASPDYLYNLALTDYSALLDEDLKANIPKELRGYAALGLGNVYSHMGDYEKAVKAYREADAGPGAGVCAGTALYRLGEAYGKLGLWVEAAGAFRKAMLLYPDATLDGPEGPYVAPLARERLKELYALGLVRERWWL